MIKGKVSVRAVTFEDLVKLNIIDKKEISLGEIELNVGDQKHKTLDDVAKQKREEAISNEINKISLQDNKLEIDIEKKEEEEKQEEREEQEQKTRDDGADDLII